MMRGAGPLATFAAKIDMGFLLGLYPRELADGFHKMREIRNKFAHEIGLESFEAPAIAGLAASLTFVEGRYPHKRKFTARERYVSSAKYMMGALYVVGTRRRNRVEEGKFEQGVEEG